MISSGLKSAAGSARRRMEREWWQYVTARARASWRWRRPKKLPGGLTAVAPDVDVEIVKFETTGDSDQTSKLLQPGGKGGAFVAEIRRRLFREISTKLTQLGTPYRQSGDCDFRFWHKADLARCPT